jgi:transporter family protein
MIPPPSASERSSAATLAGLPRWLASSVLTIICWGAVSKAASDVVDANTNQIFFTLGLGPLIDYVARSPRLKCGTERIAGIGWAFLTGILGGTGNIAFFRALRVGGQAP